MNPKIDKVAREIVKTRSKITEAQERLRDLERQKTDLENTEIVSLYRSANITPGELAEVIRVYRENGTIANAADTIAPVAANRWEDSIGDGSAVPDELEDDTDE